MAEAIAIVGVLSSVLQVVDFTVKLASHTQKIIKAGEQGLKDSHRTEALADQYNVLGSRSAKYSSVTSHNAEEQTISTLGSECEVESRELLDRLQALKIDPKSKGLKRLADGTRKAGRALKGQKEIERSRQRLQELNGQLATAILQLLLANQQTYTEPISRAVDAAATSKGHDVHKVLVFRQQLERWTQHIIASLHFPEIQSRQDTIVQAYLKTYHWALEDEAVLLRPWLRAGNGIFWISGKAGSGKSTLMKFLCEHYETQKLLAEWCGGQSLVFANFYFWYAGTSLQKSILGLLRTILHKILTGSPELVQIAFPKRVLDDNVLKDDTASTLTCWTFEELAEGLKAVAAHESSPGQRTRYCFFIDGLDEYVGNHMELVCILNDLVRHHDIKLCVSSRPWNAFREPFETKVPSLRLEDLSGPDIRRYVKCRIQEGLEQSQLASTQDMKIQAPLLVEEIANKAEGVFLWIILVVNSVLRGLAERDPISMLRFRVQDFPSDLEDFFRSIMSRVDPVYKAHTNQALKLACMYVEEDGIAKRLSTFVDYWLIRQYPRGLADTSFVSDFKSTQLSVETWYRMKSETRSMLCAACKDLLCLPGWGSTTSASVEFLHRTVYDFLRTDEMQRNLDAQIPTHFKDSRILHLLNLARLKLRPPYRLVPSETGISMNMVVEISTTMFIDMPVSYLNEVYVEQFEDVVLFHHQDANQRLPVRDSSHDFLPQCERKFLLITFVAFRRYTYIMQYVNDWSHQGSSRDVFGSRFLCSLRSAAFGEDCRNKYSLHQVSLELVKKLADTGLLVHDKVDDGGCSSTLWQLFLRKWAISTDHAGHQSHACEPSESQELRQIWELAKLMLSGSASLEARFCSNPSPTCDVNHRHKRRTAAKLLKMQVPSAWLLECQRTLALAEGGEKQGNERKCDADISVSDRCAARQRTQRSSTGSTTVGFGSTV